MTGSVRFDRGTLELGPGLCVVAGALWDARSSSHRVAAYRFRDLVSAADAAGRPLVGDLRATWGSRARDTTPLGLRSYQQQALSSWTAFGRRGVVVLPTGSGKTRVAIAAIFETGLPAAVLCPTRALAAAWIVELERCLGEPVGLVGDGEHRVERVTVLTFESAFRHMDTLGHRFGLLVVDETHHFGSGARVEALEASAAVARLGLTATAPERGSEQSARLEMLVGPVVFELSYADLVGTHLAPLSIVRVPVRLEPDEREEYEAKTRAFRELRRTFLRSYPGADIGTLLRGLARSPEGARALRDHGRAPAPNKQALVYELVTTGTGDARRASARARHAPHAAA